MHYILTLKKIPPAKHVCQASDNCHMILDLIDKSPIHENTFFATVQTSLRRMWVSVNRGVRSCGPAKHVCQARDNFHVILDPIDESPRHENTSFFFSQMYKQVSASMWVFVDRGMRSYGRSAGPRPYEIPVVGSDGLDLLVEHVFFNLD